MSENNSEYNEEQFSRQDKKDALKLLAIVATIYLGGIALSGELLYQLGMKKVRDEAKNKSQIEQICSTEENKVQGKPTRAVCYGFGCGLVTLASAASIQATRDI